MNSINHNNQNLFTELVVVDSQVKNWQSLVSNDIPVLLLNSSKDGLTQIAEAVSAYSGLDAIHIISHGSTGNLLLGAGTVNSDNLSGYANQLATIGNTLSANGDILLYGCDVAQGESGQNFINQLSSMTGADIAASNDLTGAINQGGDWNLEVQTGAIESSLALNSSTTTTYNAILGLPDLTGYISASGSSTVTEGSYFSFDSYVRNIGDTTATTSSFLAVGIYVDDVFYNTKSYAGSYFGSTYYPLSLSAVSADTIYLDTSDSSVFGVGTHSLRIKVDDYGSIAEINDSNNDSNTIYFTVESAAPANNPPVANFAMQEQAVEGQLFNYTIPDNAFTDPDGDPLTYTPSNVPAWLIFDGSKSFSGTPQLGSSDVSIDITATDPSGASISSTLTLTTPAPVLPEMSISAPVSLNEGNSGITSFMFTVNRANSSLTSTVNYTVSGITATADDFANNVFPSNTITFNPGQTTQSIIVSVVADTVYEPNEAFNVVLSQPSNATISSSTTSGTILNDDVLPTLNITATDANKVESSGAFTFTVNRSPSAVASTVNYSVSGGTASNDDFTNSSGTLNFAPNQSSQMITINVANDSVVESDETFNVVLSNPSNATLGTAAATGTILNDDIDHNIPTAGNDTLVGKPTNDFISALSGDDSVSTLEGNDTLDGGLGVDTLDGGTGNDSYYVDNILDVVIETSTLATEIDTVNSSVTYTLPDNVENLNLLNIGGAISGTGNNQDNGLTGNSSANTLDGGRGADTMDGKDGNDIYIVDNVRDSVTEQYGDAVAGIDTVRSYVSYTLSDNIENLTLIGSAATNAVGNALSNILTGNAAANTLNGNAGADKLLGGAGSDVLIGGLGKDVLTGGTGADKFKFATATESGITATTRDTITDFNHAQGDKIDLFAIDANNALTGNQAFTFINTAAFSNTNATGQVRFDAASHIVYASTDADIAPEFSILLTGVSSLSSSEFIL